MKNEFVPYELALKLKQLEFDEPCLSYYDKNGELKRSLLEYPISRKNNFHESCKIFIAPLFQQAFRFFREEHGHNGVVEGCKKHGFEWCIFPDMEHYIKPPNNFNTYEEAELACLDKLIEIVELKQQSNENSNN